MNCFGGFIYCKRKSRLKKRIGSDETAAGTQQRRHNHRHGHALAARCIVCTPHRQSLRRAGDSADKGLAVTVVLQEFIQYLERQFDKTQ